MLWFSECFWFGAGSFGFEARLGGSKLRWGFACSVVGVKDLDGPVAQGTVKWLQLQLLGV